MSPAFVSRSYVSGDWAEPYITSLQTKINVRSNRHSKINLRAAITRRFQCEHRFPAFHFELRLDLRDEVGVRRVHRVTDSQVGIIPRNYVDIAVAKVKLDLASRRKFPALFAGLGIFVIPMAERDQSQQNESYSLEHVSPSACR